MRALVLTAFALASTGAAALTRPSEIATLTRTAARTGESCSVTGVVTVVANWQRNAFILADEANPNGPGVYVTGKVESPLAAGDVVAIEGRTTESFMANAVRASRIERIRRSRLPDAPDASLAALNRGVWNMRRVRLRGTVQRVDRSDRTKNLSTLRVGTVEGAFDAHVVDNSDLLPSLINADVEVSGVAFALYTRKSEFIGVQIEVASPEDVRILAAARTDPFALPETDLDRALLFYVKDIPDTHARHVSGVVTCVIPGEAFCLQAKSGAMWARVVSDLQMPEVGDEVEVVGFTDIVNGVGEFDVWKLRVCRSGADLPAPIGLEDLRLFDTAEGPEEGFNGLSGYRVRIRGRLVGMVRGENRPDEIAVQVPDGIVQVVLAGKAGGDLVDVMRFEPVVEASGVVQITFRQGLQRLLIPRISSITMRASVPSDIVIVDRGGFDAHMKARRAWTILSVIVALVLLLLLVRIARDLRRRRRLEAVISERKRMSMDLHDTIEQNLAVSSMMLNSSLLSGEEVPSEVRHAVHDVSEMLMQTKRDIRSIIMNLRNDELFDKSPAEVLRGLAAKLSTPDVVRVRTHLRGMPQHIDGHILAEIIYVVQEAVSNAIRHGHANTVLIASDPSDGGFTLSVANNGTPFDPATAPGVAEGHFGLSGMRTRAKRGGFTVEFGMKGGLTVVRLKVPFSP